MVLLMINDVRRAHFYAKIQRDVYIELPKEDPDHGKGLLGKLKLCLYGTRDAAKGWQETLSSQLEEIGFVRGQGHQCLDALVPAGGQRLSGCIHELAEGVGRRGKEWKRIME